MDAHYMNTSYPYSTVGSFMDYFEGLAYEHVNFIFATASHGQVFYFLIPNDSNWWGLFLCVSVLFLTYVLTCAMCLFVHINFLYSKFKAVICILFICILLKLSEC